MKKNNRWAFVFFKTMEYISVICGIVYFINDDYTLIAAPWWVEAYMYRIMSGWADEEGGYIKAKIVTPKGKKGQQ